MTTARKTNSGIGDNGDWATLETKLIPTPPGRDPMVAGSGEVLVSCDWKPNLDKHTCLKVAVLPRTGEINVDNNFAQENVGTFDSAGGSSHEPIVLATHVRSPFTMWRKVDAVVRGLPAGWHAVVNHAWLWAAPKGTQELEVVMWTDLHAPYDFTPAYIRRKRNGEWQVPPRALIRVEGWTTFDHRYLPIGGFSRRHQGEPEGKHRVRRRRRGRPGAHHRLPKTRGCGCADHRGNHRRGWKVDVPVRSHGSARVLRLVEARRG